MKYPVSIVPVTGVGAETSLASAGLVIVTLPMFGDYFTNDLLSGTPRTSMVGNLIDDAVSTPGQGTNAAVLVLMLTVLLILPMLYYVYTTSKATREQPA